MSIPVEELQIEPMSAILTQLQDMVARPASTCSVDLKLVKVSIQSIVFHFLSLHGFGSV